MGCIIFHELLLHVLQTQSKSGEIRGQVNNPLNSLTHLVYHFNHTSSM
jgi:hypothetical protein